MTIDVMSRLQLERALLASDRLVRRLRLGLTRHESIAARLREQREHLVDVQADDMARIRDELRVAERRSAILRERLQTHAVTTPALMVGA